MADKQAINSSLATALRTAIAADSRSMRDLATAAGIDVAQVSRFMASQRDLSLDAADKLASVLGIVVKQPRKRS